MVLQESTALEERCATLEKELRTRKRECEKLQALHFRLRNDMKVTGGDLRCGNNMLEEIVFIVKLRAPLVLLTQFESYRQMICVVPVNSMA